MIARVLRRLFCSLTDEFAGLGLLYGVMRHGDRPPRRGPISGVSPAALLSGDRAALFGALPAAVGLAARSTPLPAAEAARVAGCGGAFDFAFPSPDRTVFERNDLVRGRVWRSAAPVEPRRAVLALDGIVQPSFGNLRTLARVVCPAGLDLVTIDLPLNHRRTPPGFAPGQLTLGGDLAHVLGVLRQAVRDTACALRSLHAGGEYPGGVGLAGVSFGGWVALQTAGLLGSIWEGEARGPRWVCGVCPAADLLAALTDGGAIVRAARGNLGIGSADLPALAGVASSLRPADLPRPAFLGGPGEGESRVLLHAARFDRFVPNAAIERLAAAWGASLRWHATGHIGLAARPRYLREVAAPWAEPARWAERS